MLNHKDWDDIKRELDCRYVLQSSCNDVQAAVNNRLANDDKRIEIIVHDFKIIKWLVSTVAASSIGALVVSLIELILR